MQQNALKRVLVTGGAGFIGSHLVDRLMGKNFEVTVLDNLSSGSLDNLKQWLQNLNFTFIKGDLKNPALIEEAIKQTDLIFHFAANPEVRVGETEPLVHFEENFVTTFNLLEALRKKNSVRSIVFASTSTVYGEASTLPTPEDYGPSIPISTYGASKQGAEAFLSAYAYTFDLRVLILRFANIVGPRATIGVIVDLIRKLQKDPKHLQILGDGTQSKSYLYVDDCVNAIFCSLDTFLKGVHRVDIYNIGSFDQVSVARIAQIVIEEMGIPQPQLFFTGGVDGGRGWRGDVKNMNLSVEKLLQIGWKPKFNSEEAVRITVRKILNL
jgi:UDP-glucose 4-epimerase